MFDQGRSAFHPVAIVAIKHAVDVADFSAVDMPTHHTLVAALMGLVGYRFFKVGDKVLFGKYAGQTVKVDGEEVLVIREEEILAVVQ